MIRISEWLPNPAGSDTAGEWIELFNGGAAPVNISGWTIKNSGKGKFIFKSQIIGGNQYLVLPRSETKFTLKNTDEKLFLYDADGKLIDQAAFSGTAPEGKSFSRTDEGFYFSTPTPVAKNAAPLQTAIVGDAAAFGAPLRPGMGSANLVELVLACGLLFSIALTLTVKKDNALSKLIFGKD